MDLDSISKRLQKHLKSASDTEAVMIGFNILDEVVKLFEQCFPGKKAVVIADRNTYQAAGEQVKYCLSKSKYELMDTYIFEDSHVAAHYSNVEKLVASLSQHDAIPIAVGAGTINDVTKLAAYETGRSYMSVATAASMDGYTAFGASITRHGSKQTFYCPAPKALLADIQIIREAPPEMNAAGYADLLAKITAGADWIVADALGAEAIDNAAWGLVQPYLRDWISSPAHILTGEEAAVCSLIEGLVMAGLGMQASKSSRPASGAEHQFSHLWDMQGHSINGVAPSHGFKVGIGMLASSALYENVLRYDWEGLDLGNVKARWPDIETLVLSAREKHKLSELADMAENEIRAKYIPSHEIVARFRHLQSIWPDLKNRLTAQLIPTNVLRQMLVAAGAPAYPEEIGISMAHLKQSYFAAQTIRRRYTVLDIAFEAGLLQPMVEECFSDEGFWSLESNIPMASR